MQRNITFPAYLSWTDDILREREKNETDEDKFGVGSLVLIEDEVQVSCVRFKCVVLSCENLSWLLTIAFMLCYIGC